LGQAIARELEIPFIDGDHLHPPENIEKMSNGIPLDDNDRAPWLQRIRAEGVAACKRHDESAPDNKSTQRGVVIACSSLKKSYRKVLRGEDDLGDPDLAKKDSASHNPFTFPTRFAYIHGERDELFRRMAHRQGHYMKPEMLESQLATLEPPDSSIEEGIITVELNDPTSVQVEKVMAALEREPSQ
jgi:gluconokinase